MIHSVIWFDRPGLEDDASTRAQNVNGCAGRTCAVWLKRALETFPNDGIDADPVAEDWGWVLGVKVGPDKLMLGCTEVGGEDPQWCIQVADFFNRGLLPGTRRRKAEALQKLSAHVEAHLRAQPDVSKVRVERGLP